MKVTESEKERMRAYRITHADEIRVQRAAFRAMNRGAIASRQAEYYAANAERLRTYQSEYRKAHPETVSEYAKQHRTRHPERAAARGAVKNAVRSGRIPKPNALICACGAPAQQYHHHLGYEPEHKLDVIAVCKECHIAAHKKETQNEIRRN